MYPLQRLVQLPHPPECMESSPPKTSRPLLALAPDQVGLAGLSTVTICCWLCVAVL